MLRFLSAIVETVKDVSAIPLDATQDVLESFTKDGCIANPQQQTRTGERIERIIDDIGEIFSFD